MKYLLTLITLSGLLSAPAFAKSVKCRAADAGNNNRKNVAVTVVGRFTEKPKITEYGDYKISVVHNIGSEFEPQTSLRLKANKFSSNTLNVSSKSLYQLMGPNLFLQCWFE